MRALRTCHIQPLFPPALVLISALALPSGCAHYTLPATHLDTPETLGATDLGRIEFPALMLGADLNATPTTRYVTDKNGNVTSTYLQGGQGLLAGGGFVLRLGDRTEAGIRVLPMAPLAVRIKHQLSGEDEAHAHRKSFSIAVVASPGFITGGGGGANGTAQATLLSMDAGLIAGYRLWEKHLFTLTPFFSFASLSNVTTISNAGTNATSATQFGASLGYQYQLENFFLRTEAAYTSGNLDATRIGGLFFGALLGLNLPTATQ